MLGKNISIRWGVAVDEIYWADFFTISSPMPHEADHKLNLK